MSLSEIMENTTTMPLTLQRSLNVIDNGQKIGISKERFALIEPEMRKYIAFWREYPDMFIDFLQTGENGEIPQDGLKFYFYQRVFLRACLR